MNNVTPQSRDDQIEGWIADHRRKLGLPDNELTKRVDLRRVSLFITAVALTLATGCTAPSCPTTDPYCHEDSYYNTEDYR